MIMNTRCLLLMTSLLGLAPAALLGAAPRPDILLIMPDQMRGDCLSAVGHPVLRTPTLDALAQQGVLFRRAYSSVPSCIPARYALLTGQSPQYSGVVGFRAKRINTTTLPGALAQAGYVTALVGRNMHQPEPDARLGYQQVVHGSTYIADDEYDEQLKRKAPQSGGIRELVKTTGLTYNHWEAAPWPLEESLHPTTWACRRTVQAINQTPPEQSLFLTASLYAPHSPLFPPKQYFDRYLAMKLPSPAMGNWVDRSQLPSRSQVAGNRVALDDATMHRAEAGYFGLITHLDHEIAAVIDAFKERSEKAGRPWLIIFTSDHGEMLGDHGYYRKCEPYEGAANIPMIIAGSPELGFKNGAQCMSPVTLEDIMPTLLQLADARTDSPIDGVSLLPALRNPHASVRTVLHFEHAPCYSKDQAFQALTDGRYKYIWRTQSGREQLFDLQADPHEEHDLSQVPTNQQRLIQWRRRLVKTLTDRSEGFVANGELVPGRPYKPINPGMSRSDHAATH